MNYSKNLYKNLNPNLLPMQQAIDILDEMIGWFQKAEILQITWGWSDKIPVSKMIEQFEIAKSRIQTLWDGWTYQDPRPNDRWIEY